jgi:murein DD-endopeptidase MepM/ murein hydrolase activator NlpD
VRVSPMVVPLLLFPAPVATVRPCWNPPVVAAIAEPFRAPACTWCAGNRGIEYATEPGDAVHAVAAGQVSFAGEVAGTRYVVVRDLDGLRVTYGNLAEVMWRAGDTVVAGVLIGRAQGHVHIGVRRGDEYIDPGPMFGELIGVVRLVPTGGAPGVAAPPPRLRCPG